MKKNWFLFIALCLLTGTFFSCNKKEEKKEVIIAIIPKIDNAIFDQVKQSALEAGKELGITITWEAPTSINGKVQKELIENLIHYKVDGILISCNDAVMLKDPINKAVKAGIKVGTFDSDCLGSDRSFYIGTNNRKAGKTCAETMLNLYKKINKKPEQILLLCGGMNAQNMTDRMTGFRSVIKDNQIAEVLYSFEMPDYGKDILTYKLANDPKINGVQLFWAVPVLNGVDSVPALPKFMKNRGVCVFFDVSRPLLRFIKDNPNCATMKQDFHSMGYEGVKNLYNIIMGKSYEIEILHDVTVIDQTNAEAELNKL